MVRLNLFKYGHYTRLESVTYGQFSAVAKFSEVIQLVSVMQNCIAKDSEDGLTTIWLHNKQGTVISWNIFDKGKCLTLSTDIRMDRLVAAIHKKIHHVSIFIL